MNRLFRFTLLTTAVGFMMPYGINAASPSPSQVATPARHPFAVPEKAIILTGDTAKISKDLYAVFYNTENLAFNDPSVPRFQFVDREGKTILGIGGQLETFVYFDFGGGIDNYKFNTYGIPVPADYSLRSQLGANINQSGLFLKLAHATRWGIFSMYIQSNFSGGPVGKNFVLKQAYLSLGGVTAGLTNTTFSDPAAGLPTIDPAGPAGELSCKNILVAYKRNFSSKFSGTISIEMPKVTYTLTEETQSMNQRVPDIPINLQYTWWSGSHIRIGAILRNLSYRDNVRHCSNLVTGWGVQVSGVSSALSIVDVLYQVSYGKGIGSYVNDLSGQGIDLIPSGLEGLLIAPKTLSAVGGVRFTPNPKFFISGGYSFCRLYDQTFMGEEAYRRSNYTVANAFYMPVPSLQIGIEYLHGIRTDMNHKHGSANRVEAMVKYSF